MTLPSRNKGFTIIEILMVLSLIGILAIAGTDLISDTINESRFDETVAKMESIKNAILGDPQLVEGGARSSFGYLGDVGSIPNDALGISALVTNPSLSAYSISSEARIGVGWNGAYLTAGNAATDFTRDSWGNAFEYQSSVTPAFIRSYGADGKKDGTGYDQDITVYLSAEMITATVNGFICNAAGPFTDKAQVELNYPNGSGELTQDLQTLVAADKGKFSYTGVPLGVRSISVYVPNKAAATTTVGPVILTIDKPNYFIPCNKVEINP